MAVVIHNSRHANNLPSGGEAAVGSLGQISEDPMSIEPTPAGWSSGRFHWASLRWAVLRTIIDGLRHEKLDALNSHEVSDFWIRRSLPRWIS